ncbi:FAA hydrolase family protein [Sinorhizobium meliloti]|uniref:fumarylacetoacetate hydrolase family protein n=1 Tax=Rhizobium meliloti TaxID=382 RepID=UPI000FD9E648|nr:fumarylacetoacetate hydrolase family protein [Sinorhizobium meliloti]RVI13409.1 FAA hydrolase family protein [Sinorhizobium meliloti]RVO01780.1 FAA hydrolase family protein [Sinorhizobium meliloti]
MQTALTPPPLILLPISGSSVGFPVRRVYCVGRNYAAHAREMGHDPDREAPFFFQKNADNLLPPGENFPYPARSSDVHHEVELVVAMRTGGADIPVSEAADHIFGYGVGIDFTRRDLQAEAKKAGKPWAAAKAFEHSAPVSAIVPVTAIGHPASGNIWLKVNGELRQQGDLDQMIWKVPEIIAELSRLFTLAPGDIIMTGTPSGVGPVTQGDVVACGIDGIGAISVNIV